MTLQMELDFDITGKSALIPAFAEDSEDDGDDEGPNLLQPQPRKKKEIIFTI